MLHQLRGKGRMQRILPHHQVGQDLRQARTMTHQCRAGIVAA
jgi:hypothetical protein